MNKILKKYSMIFALIVVFLFFTFLTNGRLIYAQNVSNLLLQQSYVLIMSCGMLLCILTGGNIDLSVGSTLALSAAIVAKLLNLSVPIPLSILVALMVAAIIGIVQGYLIGYVNIPPFICTLAGMFLYRGIARVILDSMTLSIKNADFMKIFTSYVTINGIDKDQNYVSALIFGVIFAIVFTIVTIYNKKKNDKLSVIEESNAEVIVKTIIIDLLIIAYTYKLSEYKGIPVMILWIILTICIFAFITKYTVFGRYFYAVGGNEKATRLSGIDTRKVYLFAYFIMSILAGFAGLIVAARIGSVDGNLGNAYEMDAIASCFIGGASAYGGSGSIKGVVVGALFLGVINQGMSIYGLSDQWQYVIKGAVLFIAVIFDVVSNKKLIR